MLELLVAVTVIAILASLVAPSLLQHVRDARVSAAKSDLATITVALEAYALTNKGYPTTTEGLDALIREPEAGGSVLDWRGPYLRGGIPKDPWGVVYIYESPSSRRDGGSYDLLTFGRDGRPSGEGEDQDLLAWDVGSR